MLYILVSESFNVQFFTYNTNTPIWIFIVLNHRNNSPKIYMYIYLHSYTLSWFFFKTDRNGRLRVLLTLNESKHNTAEFLVW